MGEGGSRSETDEVFVTQITTHPPLTRSPFPHKGRHIVQFRSINAIALFIFSLPVQYKRDKGATGHPQLPFRHRSCSFHAWGVSRSLPFPYSVLRQSLHRSAGPCDIQRGSRSCKACPSLLFSFPVPVLSQTIAFAASLKRIFTALYNEVIQRNVFCLCKLLQLSHQIEWNAKGFIYVLRLFHLKHLITPLASILQKFCKEENTAFLHAKMRAQITPVQMRPCEMIYKPLANHSACYIQNMYQCLPFHKGAKWKPPCLSKKPRTVSVSRLFY